MDSVAAGALRLAAARGDIQTLKLLSKCPGFHVDADMTGFSPLMAAVVQGQENAAVWLLQQGASLAMLKDDGGLPIASHHIASHCIAPPLPLPPPALSCPALPSTTGNQPQAPLPHPTPPTPRPLTQAGTTPCCTMQRPGAT
jgi:hypothetical protein